MPDELKELKELATAPDVLSEPDEIDDDEPSVTVAPVLSGIDVETVEPAVALSSALLVSVSEMESLMEVVEAPEDDSYDEDEPSPEATTEVLGVVTGIGTTVVPSEPVETLRA